MIGKYQGREAVARSTGMRNHPMRSSALLTWPNRRMRTRTPAPTAGAVCPVVWEGRSREAPPYPNLGCRGRSPRKAGGVKAPFAAIEAREARRVYLRAYGNARSGIDPYLPYLIGSSFINIPRIPASKLTGILGILIKPRGLNA